MSIGNTKWKLNTILFADDTVLLAESEKDLQKLVNEFSNVCVRRKLKVYEEKGRRWMIFAKRKSEAIEYVNQYRMKVENHRQCKIRINGQILEEVNGSTLCKHGSMGGEIEREPYKVGK